ncbi:MAG: hypothetical protein HY952_05150 [Elusimicrobia bacterium]|nr:hypothetical protein [Elusimicrobiota bacterium]
MGEKVVLLDKSSSAYCTAISTPTVDLSEAVVWEEVERTGLSKLEQCGVAGRYHIAIIGKEAKDYGIVTLKAVSDDTLIAATDREIKILPTLDSLKQRTQGSGSEVDRCASITNLKPTLYSLEVHGQTMLLAAYSTKRDNRVVAGPSFIVMNNRVYPLTGWCSYPYFRAFTLEGEHYIESGSHCCDCGITVMELFQITQDGPKMVWEDSSFSS